MSEWGQSTDWVRHASNFLILGLHKPPSTFEFRLIRRNSTFAFTPHATPIKEPDPPSFEARMLRACHQLSQLSAILCGEPFGTYPSVGTSMYHP